MPVLTEKAVEGACLVKDGEVFVAIFGTGAVSVTGVTATCPCRANKIGDAVSRQRVVIPTDDSVPFSVSMRQTAIAHATSRNATTLRANSANYAIAIVGWLFW
jgi:hypothetical protein